LDLRLLPRDGAPLLLNLVEEPGVDEVVEHRLRDAVLVEDDELRGHLGYLFGHQAVLPGLGLVNRYPLATRMGTATPIQLPKHTKGTAGVGAVELKTNEVPDT
jgi:hypothetical protein